MRTRTSARAFAVAAVIAIGAVACSGGGGSTSGGNTSNGGPGTTSKPKQGGSIVLGAEQWPQCLNPITDCSAASWYLWSVQDFVLPRLVEWSNAVEPQASPLIQELPSLDNGGITQEPFSVTYHLNPKAVWSDGTPITCGDVAFTWKAINNTSGAFTTAGYTTAGGAAGVKNVNCSAGASTVKLEFNKIYVDWPDLFGGFGGFILEKAAFPTANADKPNLKAEMNDSIPFSGGPFMIKSWSPEQEVLVPNPKYWDKKPYLDQVTFVPREDQPTEVSSVLSGDVDAIFPQPSNVPFADQFKQNPNVQAVGANGNFVEALWIQMEQPPMNDPKIREAFAYAMDRQSVIDGVIGLNNPTATVNNCGPWIPGQGPWCADPGPFAQYTYNPDKTKELLTGAGYNLNADTGLFEKDGKPLTITVSTTAGNVRRATTVSLLQQKALAAGIDLQIKTYVSTDLFSNVAPQGNFQVALYANGPIIDPTVTGLLSCAQIPTQANSFAGANWDHWCNKSADQLMQQSDQELDATKRAQQLQQIGSLAAQGDQLPMIPVDVLPVIAAWRTDKIGGVDPKDVASPYGFFFHLSTWYVAS
jgi:peptide/nickel transport system substrate-binding protein